VTSPGEGLGSTFSVFLPVYSAPTELSETPPRQTVEFQDLEGGTPEDKELEEERSTAAEQSKPRKGQEPQPRTLQHQSSMSLRDLRRGSAIAPLTTEDLQSPHCHPSLPTILTSANSHQDIGGPSWRVLVVDDAASNRKIMSRYLRIRGMRVDEADCGRTAVKMCTASLSPNRTTNTATNLTVDDSSPSSSSPYDVVFLDHDMPNMTGPETAANLRSIGYRGHLIGLTGHTGGDHHERFIAGGVSRVLVKPVSVPILDELFEGQPRTTVVMFPSPPPLCLQPSPHLDSENASLPLQRSATLIGHFEAAALSCSGEGDLVVVS
jgi:CheY-like chemotaxis protein